MELNLTKIVLLGRIYEDDPHVVHATLSGAIKDGDSNHLAEIKVKLEYPESPMSLSLDLIRTDALNRVRGQSLG